MPWTREFMTDDLRILILEDMPIDAELLEPGLRRSQLRFTVCHVATKADYLKSLDEFAPDLILSDYRLLEFDGRQALRWARERMPDVPFIIVTGSINEETAVECMKAGAADYVLKEHISRIGPVIQSALERKQAEARLRE